MSKALKTVVSVVAAIAIPIAAPAIASSIGLSAAIGTAVGSATAGSVIGGALVGATLGAAKAAVLGEDVGRGALFSAIGGGIGGYAGAPTAGPTPAEAAFMEANVGYAPVGAGEVGAGALTPAQTAFMEANAAYAPVGLGGTSALDTAAISGAPAGLAPSPTYMTDAAMAGVPQTTFTPQQAGLAMPGTAAPAAPAAPGAPSAAPGTFAEALKKVPEQIAAKFTDPKQLADLTLRAGGMLAGSLAAGDGLSNEERALLEAQTNELRTLQQTNADLFRQRMEQAQAMLGESRYFDPEYFGLQSARRAQTAGARAKATGLRGLEGPQREAAARRYDLATARDVGTAYDVGYGTGVSKRLEAQRAGLTAMPTAYPSAMSDYTALQNVYTGAAERQRQTQQDIGSLFGTLTGEAKAKKTGDEEPLKG